MNVALITVAFDRVLSSWPWYLTRASGLVAAGLLALLIVSGIGQITGHIFRFLEPLVAWVTHRRLGLALTYAVIIHMLALLFDRYEVFSLKSLFIPFISSYKPLYVGLGIIAFYILIAITLTSIYTKDSYPRLWKITHLGSYAVLILVFLHGLLTGTDLSGGIVRLGWIIAGGGLALLTIPRLQRARGLRSKGL